MIVSSGLFLAILHLDYCRLLALCRETEVAAKFKISDITNLLSLALLLEGGRF